MLALLALALLAAPAPAQGPGPGIDPTPIDSLPFFISKPGAYFVTDDLNGTAFQDGIVIKIGHVNLNLNGHTLSGGAASLSGVRVADSALEGITIQNGVLRDWGQNGVDTTFSKTSYLAGLRVMNCGASGLLAGFFSRIEDCQALDNTGNGIQSGIHSIVHGSIAARNKGHGFRVETGTRIDECVASLNTLDGFRLSSFCSLTNASSQLNIGRGVSAEGSSSISRCLVSQNFQNGIDITTRTRVSDCTVNVNGQGGGATNTGILATQNANVIEGNVLNMNNGVGLSVLTSGNVICRNTAAFNGLNYSIAPGNLAGPIVTAATMASNSNPQANLQL